MRNKRSDGPVVNFWKRHRDKFANYIAVVVVFGGLGTGLLVASHAATPATSVNASSATISSCASKVTDATTNSGSAVKFGGCSGNSNQQPFAVGVFFTGQDSSQFSGYQSWLGQSVPLWMVFDDRSNEYNIVHPGDIQTATALHKTAIIAYEIVLSNGQEGWANAANGNNLTSDGQTTYAQREQQYGSYLVANGQGNAIIRLVTEFNNGSGGTPPVMDSQTDINNFIAAYQTAYTNIKKTAPNVTIGWDPSPDPGDPTDDMRAYPGDAYVDVMDLDDYDGCAGWHTPWAGEQAEWTQRMNGVNGGMGYQHYLDYAYAHNIKVGFPEWGLGYFYTDQCSPAGSEPADVPLFIQNMYNLMTGVYPNEPKTLFASFWEDHNGVYPGYQDGNATPNASAMYKSLFGGKPSTFPPSGAVTGGGSSGGSSGSFTVVTVPYRLAAGSTGGFTDSNGHAWSADGYYTDYSDSGGGINGADGNTVTGTSSTPPQIFQQAHWGIQNYHIPIANGTYNINLDFAELNPSVATARNFGVTLEGNAVLPTGFNISTTAGGPYKGYTKSVTGVTVSDGFLDIAFPRGGDAPLISGIEITGG